LRQSSLRFSFREHYAEQAVSGQSGCPMAGLGTPRKCRRRPM